MHKWPEELNFGSRLHETLHHCLQAVLCSATMRNYAQLTLPMVAVRGKFQNRCYRLSICIYTVCAWRRSPVKSVEAPWSSLLELHLWQALTQQIQQTRGRFRVLGGSFERDPLSFELRGMIQLDWSSRARVGKDLFIQFFQNFPAQIQSCHEYSQGNLADSACIYDSLLTKKKVQLHSLFHEVLVSRLTQPASMLPPKFKIHSLAFYRCRGKSYKSRLAVESMKCETCLRWQVITSVYTCMLSLHIPTGWSMVSQSNNVVMLSEQQNWNPWSKAAQTQLRCGGYHPMCGSPERTLSAVLHLELEVWLFLGLHNTNWKQEQTLKKEPLRLLVQITKGMTWFRNNEWTELEWTWTQF